MQAIVLSDNREFFFFKIRLIVKFFSLLRYF